MDIKNIYPNKKGELIKVGYKTERSFISMIKKMNKNCIKYGFKTKLEVILPIPRSWNHKI